MRGDYTSAFIRNKSKNQMEYFQTIQSSRNHLDCGKLKPCEILFRKFLRMRVSSA